MWRMQTSYKGGHREESASGCTYSLNILCGRGHALGPGDTEDTGLRELLLVEASHADNSEFVFALVVSWPSVLDEGALHANCLSGFQLRRPHGKMPVSGSAPPGSCWFLAAGSDIPRCWRLADSALHWPSSLARD